MVIPIYIIIVFIVLIQWKANVLYCVGVALCTSLCDSFQTVSNLHESTLVPPYACIVKS